MIALTDYRSYYKDNELFIQMLGERESKLYGRIHDVVRVLDFIAAKVDKKSIIDEEDNIIFETGFSYLHEELEIIKIYYNDYFKREYPLFEKYSILINYLLYIEDFSEALSQKGELDDPRKKTLDSLCKKIEVILQTKGDYTLQDIDEYDCIVESCTPSGIDIMTTDYIFSLICEEIDCGC